ncbi:MAG TPA: HYR domain-containing protein, partial [Gammaproteobacteria bacterium]|nr:HYR domain-containing protein [Gammaproteobacteria bacterium]
MKAVQGNKDMKSNTYKTGVSSGHWLSLWLICLVVLSWTPPAQAEPVCARVKIEIQQELILERQAFDAMMKINNNLDTLAIDNVQVSVNFKDDAGNSVVATSDPNNTSAKFFIRIDSMTDISDVNGNGRVEPNTTGEIRWLIIPTTSAAVTPTGTLYYIGATLSYTLGGVPETVEVTPDFITVKPLPQLALDYFLTKQVIGDDPFTAPIEPSEPYTLGVRVRNNGLATAANVRIDSAQPEIKDNPQGLLIDFTITGSSVDDQPSEPVLLINFGDVAPDSAKMGRWDMLTSLAGEFISFSASMSHADELGGAATSILDQPVTHFLVRNVRVDEPGRDAVRDFLALDGQVLRVYESDNTSDEVVTDQSGAAGLDAGAPSGGDMLHTLTIPPTAGFAYVKLPDPYNGNSAVKDVIRSDGKRIPLDNAWTSKERDRSTNPPTYTYFINLFDSNVTGNYSVRMGSGVLGPVPPVVQAIANRTTSEGIQVGFLVEASDPNGQPVALSANPLPVGAVFVDNGNGTATFNWTPAVGQAGAYTITFTATDGFLSASRSPTLTVNPEWDTDGDGMDDAWEMANFGTLDRNGSGDFDGDGVPDLAEYQNGTDPTSAQVAVPPVISPPAGTYADYVEISLSSPTPNTLIYYTLDGTVPTASAFLYAGPVTVSSDTTLQAITVGNGYADSTVSTASYLITGGGPFQQDNSPQQLLVVEAEHYSATQTPGAESWSPDYTLDYSGDSAMVAQPDSGNRVASSDIANSPSLDYQVNFLTTGTHYVWVRGLAVDADGDTIHVGLDGMAFSTSDKLQLASNVLNTWGWTRTTEDGPVASFDVASTGEHTLQIWMDKDGALVDRILITTDPDYIPSNAGPAESLTNSSNGVPVLQAVADQNGVYNGVVTLALAANDPDTDTLTYSASGLPTGLLIDSVSGAISGAIDPTNAASNNVAVTVSGGSDSVTTAFSWNIVAQDIVVPTVTAPADVIAEATALTTPVSLGGPATALDDIDGSLAVTNDAPAAFPLGETFVTYSAADSAGNIGSATQRVTVQDTTPPTLVVPDDIVVISSAALSVNIGTATASDIFGPVIISNDAPALFTVGETLVTWTSTDANGNTGTAQQRITVTLVAPQDSDGDGVSDSNDLCPNTPVGESVDTSGCSDSQRDSDNDGVPDVADVCPLTPAGEPVDASGCSPSQVDSDADGVVDSSDLCPATVAGDPVDVNGCSATQEAVWDYDYPYVNGFEVVTSVHDSVLDSNPANDINGQDDWKLEGVWGMNTDHGNWTSAAGVWHLDGNPAEIDLSRYNVSQWATMNGYVTVPVDAAQPTLSYRYKLELLSGDNMYVRIQTQGSNAWTTIRSYNWRNSHSEYVRDEIDLSSYAGQAVRIRFDQRNGSGSSTRLWVIDDFQIGEPPLASYAYPYSNDFETAAADWDTQGVWAVATNHNGWTSQSGVMHLDGNPGEIDLSRYNVAQWATLNGYIPIPVDAVQPTLSYAYKLGLLSGDNMYVRIQTQGSNAWTTIRSYNWHNDHSEYVREEVDLSAYIGQAIRIRFDQRNGSGNGSRLWVIDDFQIGVPPLASYAYPYSNDFETSVTDWNTQGAWAVTTDHNVPTGQSGVSHLDGNPGEIDLSRYNVAQWATLNGYISIPVDAVQPTLSYGYQLDVLSG